MSVTARESQRALTGRTLRSTSGLMAAGAALVVPAVIANVQRENRPLLIGSLLVAAVSAIALPSAVALGTLGGCVAGSLMTANAILGPGSETEWRLLAWALGGAAFGALVEWIRRRRSGFRA